MADEIDQANELADLHLEAALQNHKIQSQPLRYVGRCYNCDEPMEPGIFCDPECASDHELRTRKRR